MKTIRKSVWETNSSSAHSLVVNKMDYFENKKEPLEFDLESKLKRTKEKYSDGKYLVHLGEYGWGYDLLTTFEEKLDYVCTEIAISADISSTSQGVLNHMRDIGFLDFLKENFGIKEISFKNLRDSYIDHQSLGTIKWALDGEYDSKEMLRLLLDESILIEISNDNGDYGVYNGYVEINNLKRYFRKDPESVRVSEDEDWNEL